MTVLTFEPIDQLPSVDQIQDYFAKRNMNVLLEYYTPLYNAHAKIIGFKHRSQEARVFKGEVK